MSFDKSVRFIIIFTLLLIVYIKEVELVENSSSEKFTEIHKRHAEQSANWPQGAQLVDSAAPADASSVASSPDGPNLVEASDINEPDIDIRKLQRLEFAKRRTREVLILDYIEEDYNFTSGEEVVEWAHVWHNDKEYFVGRREHDLQIVRLDKMVYDVVFTLEIGQPISYMVLYSFWNVTLQLEEGVLLVAADDKVFWYRFNPETEAMVLNWEWKIGRNVSGLTYFTIESNDYLAVSTNEPSPRDAHFTVYIYQFSLHTHEFRIAQRLHLRYPCPEATLLDTGRDVVVLAVPQRNKAAVYTFNPRESVNGIERIQFEFLRNYNSKDIATIAGFKMGGNWYLALGGRQPQILLYQQGDFVPKTVLGETFGLVELFFPIPIRTYRDDLILLVQRRVDFSTHFITVLETLIWNGDSFEASIPVPCHQGKHTLYGVSCMLDMHRDEGIKGATILKRKSQVAILVPRHKVESGLFYLHTKMLVRNSEYHDLQEVYSFLKEWVKEHEDLYAEAQEFIADDPDSETPWNKLDLLDTPELTTWAEIDQVYINDYLWTTEDLAVDMDHLFLRIEQLGYELLEHQRQKRSATEDELEFDVLEVDELKVEELLLGALNNEEFYIQDGGINFEGILNMHSLKVLGGLPEEASNSRTFLNLNFEEINGLSWKEIQDGLVFRDQPLTLNELTLKGEIVVEDELAINNLNDLKYPEDLLWSSGPTTSVVHGEKTFLGTLAASSVDTDDFINGINPFDVITLSKAQNWTGVPTFSDLEVSEVSQINGSTQGRMGDEEDESNPTLAESTLIQSACSFTHLEVHGSIIVLSQYGSNNLSEVLADIIQRPATPDEQIQVPSPKIFSTIEFPIDFRLHAHSVNNIPLEQFVTLHSKQDLNIATLNGYVYFNNLTMDNEGSSFDGVDIFELQNNSIKIDEPLEAPNTQLNMVQSPILESKFDVRHSLNGNVIVSGYQTIHEDLVVKAVNANELHATLAEIPGDIHGAARLNGHQLQELLASNFYQERTKSSDGFKTDPMDTYGNIFLNELTLQGGLITDALQSFKAEYLLDFLDEMDDIPEMILAGKIEVDAIVTGDVQVNKLNGQRFDEDIQLTAVWLNRSNFLSGQLSFAEPLHLQGDIYCEGTMNGQHFPDLLDNIVFRDANSTKPLFIKSTKQFIRDVVVDGNTKVDALNGLLFERIATRRREEQRFEGTLRLSGNLYVQDLTISGYLNNDNSLNSLHDLVLYDRQLGAFVLRGETVFNVPVKVQDLTVEGNLNDFRNLSGFFRSLVYKNNICLLKGKKTFTGRVSIEGGAYVRSLNGYNLLTLLNNIVMVNEGAGQVVDIKSPVTFRAPLSADVVTIHGYLKSNNLNGCSLQEWLQGTLRVDRDQKITEVLTFGDGALNSNSLSVGFVNELDMSHVITLHTPQELNSSLLFSELHLDGTLTTQGLINGVDLQAEYANTLLIHGNQHVTTPLTMQSCRVLQTLRTNAAVNHDKNLHEVATLQESLEFRSPLFLRNISARRVFTNDLVSGINLDQWHRSALWTQKRPQQWITGNWSARTLSIRELPRREYKLLYSLPELPRSVRTIQENYTEVCQHVAKLVKLSTMRVCFVKYLEEAFELELTSNENIAEVYPLYARETDYLLLNFGCFSRIYKWNNSVGFQKFIKFESGFIDQLLLVATVKPSDNFVTFITNTAEMKQNANCTQSGLNMWTLDGVVVKHSANLGRNYSNICQNRPFSSVFYAKQKQEEVIHEFSSIDRNMNDSWQFRFANDEKMSSDTEMDKIMDEITEYPRNDELTAPDEERGEEPIHELEDKIDELEDEELIKRMDKREFELENKRSGKRIKIKRDLRMEDRMTQSKNRHKFHSESTPTVAPISSLDFDEFEEAVEDILQDLSQRLSVEVNITQLSIPESDLYDVHLLEDFIDVVQKMEKQQIFGTEASIIDINSETLELPANPAQVLAARTVLFIWPVMVEFEEIHSYLRLNETHNHTLCAAINQSLAISVRDVLHLAYQQSPESKGKDYMDDLIAVIERIHELQKKLAGLVKDMNTEFKQDSKRLELEDFASEENEETILLDLGALINESTIEPNGTDSIGDMKEAWGHRAALTNKEEKKDITIEVGPAAEPLFLNVFYLPHSNSLAGKHVVGIKLYTIGMHPKLFQTIAAYNPRALVSLRIRDETLLAFVEDCCAVRVLIYRGVQGFIDLVNFTLPERVQNMNLLRIKVPENAQQRNFITVNMGKKVRFYEAVLAGDKIALPEEILCK